MIPLGGSVFAERAIPQALALASRWGASIELATVASAASGRGQARSVKGDDARERGQAMAQEYLEGVEERIRAAGFAGEVELSVLSAGNIAQTLVHRIFEGDTDFVVMTTHGRGAVERAWLGSTADGVIRRSPCPVLLLRPPTDGESEPPAEPPPFSQAPAAFKNVVVPLDGSDESESILPRVIPLLGESAEVTLLQAVPPLSAGGYPYLPHSVREEHDQQEIKEATREYLEEMASTIGGEARTFKAAVPVTNQPGAAILKVAREQEADLIAMSTAGRGGVGRLLLGSVADKVVRGSEIPVMVYREPDEG